jgi:arsenical pump membrane protein
LSFGRFAALMSLPWLAACGAEWLGLRLFVRRDLDRPVVGEVPTVPATPHYALAVLGLTVVGFVVTSAFDASPAWAAIAGCVVLLVPRVARHDVSVPRLAAEATPGFCLFVLALAVLVTGVTRHGLGEALRHLMPSGTGLGALLIVVAAAAVLANLVNNLPATFALVPLVAAQPAWVLAMLLGVNIGPNATYAGSLATLLWRRLLPDDDKPNAAQFHAHGALSVPVVLVLCTVSLWVTLDIVRV